MASAKRTFGALAAVVVAFALVALLIMSPIVNDLVGDMFGMSRSVPAEASYVFDRTIVIDADGGELMNITVDLPVPQDLVDDGVFVQSVASFQSDQSYQSTSVGEAPWATWYRDYPGGFDGTFTIRVRYDLTVTTLEYDVDASTSGDISDLPSWTDVYLGDYWENGDGDARICPSDPAIASLAQEIAGGEEDVYTILESVYDWVEGNIDYPTTMTSADPKTAVEVLETGVGDCDEQSMLVISLARALDVPAWLQLGFLYDPGSGEMGGHGWVRTYVPTDDGGTNVTMDVVNDRFMVHTADLVVEYTDDGNEEHLDDYYYFFRCAIVPGSYPAGGGPTYEQTFGTVSYEHSGDVQL